VKKTERKKLEYLSALFTQRIATKEHSRFKVSGEECCRRVRRWDRIRRVKSFLLLLTLISIAASLVAMFWAALGPWHFWDLFGPLGATLLFALLAWKVKPESLTGKIFTVSDRWGEKRDLILKHGLLDLIHISEKEMGDIHTSVAQKPLERALRDLVAKTKVALIRAEEDPSKEYRTSARLFDENLSALHKVITSLGYPTPEWEHLMEADINLSTCLQIKPVSLRHETVKVTLRAVGLDRKP
jgi:hypothetical protein